VRCRSDSIANLAQRPTKRARSVSSQAPSRQQSLGPEQPNHISQYQSVLSLQPPQQYHHQPPPQQHLTKQNNHQHPSQHQQQITNQHGIDVAAFGFNQNFTTDGGLDPGIRAAFEASLSQRSNSVSHFSPGTSISPTIEEMNSFGESHGIDIDFDSALMEVTGSKMKPKKNAAVEENEIELKRLAAETTDVSMDVLANRVRNDENGPQAEKTRQVFGMAW